MKKSLKKWALVVWFCVMSIGIGVAGFGFVNNGIVHAAPAAKYQEPGTCVKFATVGSYDQYHCVDPTGNEYDTNTAGMMLSVGN